MARGISYGRCVIRCADTHSYATNACHRSIGYKSSVFKWPRPTVLIRMMGPNSARSIDLHRESAAMAVKFQPETYHTITPYLIVRGAVEAIEWYKKALGAAELFRFPGPP